MNTIQSMWLAVKTFVNSNLQKRHQWEVARTLIFGALSLLALIPMWDTSQVIFYFVGAMSILALYSHISRRLFFPYINMHELADSAINDKNMPAAILFASVTAVICTTLIVAGGLIGFAK